MTGPAIYLVRRARCPIESGMTRTVIAGLPSPSYPTCSGISKRKTRKPPAYSGFLCVKHIRDCQSTVTVHPLG